MVSKVRHFMAIASFSLFLVAAASAQDTGEPDRWFW